MRATSRGERKAGGAAEDERPRPAGGVRSAVAKRSNGDAFEAVGGTVVVDDPAAVSRPVPRASFTKPSTAFAKQMRIQRERKGMTQRELAVRLGALGFEVHQTTVGKWEAGERRISLDEALVICAALDVAPAHMIAGSFLPARMKRPFLALSGSTRPVSPREMRQWVRGQHPLWDQDEKRYSTEIAPDEWRALRVAGVAELVRGVEELVNAWADDDIEAALEIVESLEDEVGRQRRALERDGRSREDGHVPSRLVTKR